MNEGGCGRLSPGIGHISYVKDLQTEEIVTTKFRCSNFGTYYLKNSKLGWVSTSNCHFEILYTVFLSNSYYWNFIFWNCTFHVITNCNTKSLCHKLFQPETTCPDLSSADLTNIKHFPCWYTVISTQEIFRVDIELCHHGCYIVIYFIKQIATLLDLPCSQMAKLRLLRNIIIYYNFNISGM